MKTIGRLIAHVLKDVKDEGRQKEAREQVRILCEKFPLYRDRILRH
jgi:glycine/serine hydroxymethyltransferase